MSRLFCNCAGCANTDPISTFGNDGSCSPVSPVATKAQEGKEVDKAGKLDCGFNQPQTCPCQPAYPADNMSHLHVSENAAIASQGEF